MFMACIMYYTGARTPSSIRLFELYDSEEQKSAERAARRGFRNPLR